IDGAAMVADPFHGRAGVTQGVRISFIVAKIGIIRRNHDVAAFGELNSVVQVRLAANTSGFALADRNRLVETKHRRSAELRPAREEQVSGNAVAVAGCELDFSAAELREGDSLHDGYLGRTCRAIRQRPHDLLHAREDLHAALAPGLLAFAWALRRRCNT